MGTVRDGLTGLNRVVRLWSVACSVGLLGALAVVTPVLAAGPAVSISPPYYNYGTLAVGAQSAARAFVVTNTGTSDLHVGSVSLGGTNPSDFRISLAGCDYHTVNSGAACTEYVVFAPKEAFALSATLTFPDDAAGSPQTVALTGTGTGPVMSYAPASLDFPLIPVGQTSAPQTFYVKDAGDSPLTITSAAPQNGGGGVLTIVSDGCSGTTIPAGTYCRMIVAFRATAAVSGGTGITFQANTNPSFQNYNMSESGLGVLAQTYFPSSFGYVPQNSTSQPSYVQLQNAGNVPMHVSGVALGGASATQFAITSDTCTGATVDTNSLCRVYLTFNPTTTGQISATMSFTDDGADSPQSSSIYGIGIAPGAIPSQTAIDFGVISDAGGTASQTVQLSNPTAQPLHVTTAAISAGGSVFHTSADSCSAATILPGASCSVTVTFAPPSSFAGFTGTLTFSDDGSPSGQQLVSLAGQGVDPQITYAPDQVNFGNQRVGTRSAARTLTITNTGSTSWTPQNVQLEGTYYGAFSLDASGCTQALAPGASCQALITFDPTGTQLFNALLDVVNPVTGSINKVPVSGSGVAPVVAAISGILFGNQRVGTSLPGYAIWLTNSGTDTLHVTSLSISGANASSFTIGATNCPGASVAVNATCDIPISFLPAATGLFTATLSVVDDAWNGPSQFGLSGTGVQAHATFAPTSVSFPNTATGQSAGQTISVMSDGSASLDLSSMTLSGSGAAAYTLGADTCSGQQLPATIGCSVRVTFTPPAVGSYPASLLVADDAAGSPQAISLTGNDLASNATASPSSLSFGGLRPGKAATPQTVTLTNDGNTTVRVATATLSGDPSFSLAADTCSNATLALGATCTVQIGFTPATLGSLQATLSFGDDAANSPQVVAVTGSGIQPAVSLSAASLAFGNQAVGLPSAGQSVVVTNSGTDTLNIGAAGVAAPFGIVTDTCSNTAVAPGSTCTIQVDFAPTATGPASGALSIPDDATGSPQSVALSGTGIYPHATASPSSINFGSVPVGGRGSQTATLTNDGSTVVHVGTTTLTGDQVFGLSADTCSGTTLSVGAACTVQVNFISTTAGAYVLGTLAFNDDAGNSPQTVALSGHDVQPAVSLSVTSLAFGNQLVGTRSANQSVVVTNSGSSNLNIGTATAAAPFAIATDGCSNTAVAAGSSCTIQVNFAAATPGAASGTLSIPDDAPTSPQTVALSGTGLQPHATASPTTIAFGGVRPGKTATAQTVTLTNDGNTTVHVSTATLTGDGSFTVAANTCTGATLPVGGTCTVQLGFAPANLGSFTATLTFSDDAVNSPQTVAISGSGVMPAVSLSASSLAFGKQVVGVKSANQPVVVTNSGTGTLNVGVASAGAPFAIASDGCSNTAVAPGGSCTIQVNFTPAATGPASGTLSIPDDAPGSPQTGALSGTGVQPRAIVSPTSLSFGSVKVGPGNPAAQQYVTVTNSGTASLHIATNAFAGNLAFTIGTSCAGATVAPGASCKIGVYASPDTIGLRSGTLQVADDAPGSPQTVSLSVTGLSGQLTFTPTSFNFGSVHVGSKSSKLNLKVQNTGNAGMTISTVVITGPNASSFVIESTSCANKQLSTGASCSVSVYMKPAVTGPLSAAVTFTDDGLSGTQNVALTGTGV
jgi:hypothetical protein